MIGIRTAMLGRPEQTRSREALLSFRLKHKSKRSGPEVFGQCDNPFVGLGVFGKKVDFGNMRNQRIKDGRPLAAKIPATASAL